MNINYNYVMKDFSEDYISFIRDVARKNEEGLICINNAELYFEGAEQIENDTLISKSTFTIVGIHEDVLGEVYGEIGKLLVEISSVGDIILQWDNFTRKEYDNTIANKAISNILTSFASFAK